MRVSAICSECGQITESELEADSGLCHDCQAAGQEDEEDYEREQLIEKCLDCRCGAYGFSKTGQPYHAADCVCGRT